MAAFAFASASAWATPTFAFTAYLNGAGGHSSAGGNLSIGGIDPSKSVRIEVNPLAGPANAPVVIASPGSTVDLPFIPGLAGGDTVSVWQPADKSEAPTERVLQAPTINYVGGALKGTVPAGFTAAIQTDGACERQAQQFLDVPNDFDIPFAGESGMFLTISATNGADSTVVESSTSGETPCIRVNASSRPSGYTVAVTHLTGTTSETSKVVLERGGTPLDQATGDGTGVVLNSASVPQPGDVVKFYKPAGAPSPAKTATIPAFDASFDTGSDLVSVDAPAASAIRVTPQHTIQFRLLRELSGGTTEFDFAQPGNSFPAYNIQAGDAVYAEFVSPDHSLEYYVDAVDQTPVVAPEEPKVIEKGAPQSPTDSVRPKAKLSIVRVAKRSFKTLTARVTSDESARFSAVLSFPRFGRQKAVKLSTLKGTLKSGITKLRFTPTRIGRKALRSVTTKRSATLTITLVDASGNATTVKRSLTIEP